MKKIAILFCLLILISCANNNLKDFSIDEKEKALKDGKAVVSIEWNYKGYQLYTLWLNDAHFNSDFARFYWFTGNNSFTDQGPKDRSDIYRTHVEYSNRRRYFIVEPGTYILYDIHNQTNRPFSMAGKDWYIFTKTLGKDLNAIKKNLKDGDYFAKFTVKAGQEIALPKVEVLYDGMNYIDKNNPNSKEFVINVFNNNNIYTFGKQLKVNYINDN